MNNKKNVLLTVIISVALASACSKSKSLRLQLNLDAGKTYRTKMVSEQIIKQTFKGAEQSISQRIGMGYSMEVLSRDEKNVYDIRVKYDSIEFEQKGPFGLIEYNSEHPPENVPPMAMGFASLLGQSFNMKLDSMGKVYSIEGIDKIIDNLLNKMNIPNDNPMSKQIRENLKSTFGEDSIKESMKSWFSIYREEPIKVGDLWTQDMRIEKGFPMIINSTFTLTERKKNVATITVISSINTDDSTSFVKMGKILMSYNLKGEQKGNLKIDELTGMISGGSLTQDVKGSMTINSDIDKLSSKQEIPMSIQSKIEFFKL